MRAPPLLALVVLVACRGDAPTPATVEKPVFEAAGASVVLVGAGDIARCGQQGAEATARLLDTIPGTVFTTGDNAYPDGTASDFSRCYGPTWGRHKARTRPSPGNHDYHTADGQAYFAYFGETAGRASGGYYSYDLGDWHVISLNSEIDMDAGSPQVRWLREDLAAHARLCTVAYWHEPRFSSGARHGSSGHPAAVWEELYQAGVEVVLNGHEHIYERFAPQNPDGAADPERGIRQFTVGTGGASLYDIAKPLPNSEVRANEDLGVLKLTLYAGGYAWDFVPVAGGHTRDSGAAPCHN